MQAGLFAYALSSFFCVSWIKYFHSLYFELSERSLILISSCSCVSEKKEKKIRG